MISIETVSDSKKALKTIATDLLKKKLTACTHITKIPYSSYIWEGKIVTKKEYKLKVKTIEKHKKSVISIIEEKHNYEIFELLIHDISNLDKNYKQWFKGEIK